MKPSETVEFITFTVGAEIFALETATTREVSKCKAEQITRVPGMPAHLPGVVNLRGDIVSIVDVAPVLGLSACENDQAAWILIAETTVWETPMPVGIRVMKIEDVVQVKTTRIGPPPEIGMNMNIRYIKGVCEHGTHLIAILDLEKIIGDIEAELAAATGVAEAETAT